MLEFMNVADYNRYVMDKIMKFKTLDVMVCSKKCY